MKLNHALLMCENITAMEDFFIRIIGFENGPRPPFPFAGSWLYSDGQPLIHLVGKTPFSSQEPSQEQSQQAYLRTVEKDTEAKANGIIDHLAFQGGCYRTLIRRLDEQQATYFERTIPLSNEHQVFVIGPEQIKLEILFNQDRSSLN
ncbi:hypothetical protein [Aliamphritea spongicola]|uniref:hypothetical protein n=1 Tax=Aliamphritea spongicola TaxID=707589 RepID=UPI00196A2EEE|nr:hypothetical protein [Aliamphritea spongicola]MBN3561446.1 hypothetical protein [Aliamphritea spongicola]